MKLLVILLCLLSERFLIHSVSYKRFAWFVDYDLFIKNIIDKNNFFTNPWMILTAIILPIIIPIAIIYLLLHTILFGILCLILSIVIFLYCLGPQNAFYPISDTDAGISNNILIGNYFAQVNRQLLSVIFWYTVAGPIAILTYRLITLCRNVSSVSHQANQVTDILEWIPARISALLFLLVGNFQRGFILFTKMFFSRPELNNQLLSNCGIQAVRTDESEEIPIPVAESLVEHATIVFLVFIALFTLVAWL